VRTLVTGGAGFIGSMLVDRLLAEGHAVDVVDDLSAGRLDNLAEARADRRNVLSIHHFDIRHPEVADLVARREPEVIFHLAARDDADAMLDTEVTVLGTLRVLDGAVRARTRKIVFASSASIYGEVDKPPIRESTPCRPLTHHAVAKRAAVDHLQVHREQHGIEFTALALGSVYGPRQVRGVVPAFVAALRAGKPAAVTGDGRQTRDFVFVDDAVDAFVRAAERGSGLTVNVGTGVETSVLDVLGLVVDGLGLDGAEHTSEPVPPGERRRSALDVGRARIHLGWSPWTTLADGIAETVAAG
jgi:UDP-glucose 4-epimerase